MNPPQVASQLVSELDHGSLETMNSVRAEACCCKLLDLMSFPVDANAKRPLPNKTLGLASYTSCGVGFIAASGFFQRD